MKGRNHVKPMRIGWIGLQGGFYVDDYVVKVGRKMYKHSENGKNYDMVDLLTANLKTHSRLVPMYIESPFLK